MYAIITDLSSEAAKQIEQIRAEAVTVCGSDPAPLQWPLHISWQGAERYQMPEVESRMRLIAKTFPPMTTSIEGVGVFTGPDPVLYLPVTRTPELTALNATLWEALFSHSHNSNPYFSPAQWVPHITLLYGKREMTEAIGCLVATLLNVPINIEITLDHFYMGYFHETGHGIQFKYPLLGKQEEA